MIRIALQILVLSVVLPAQVLQDVTPLRLTEETADFKKVHAAVHRLLEKHDGEEILVVLDIDNTLLAMSQDLGSDQWFNWQDDLLASRIPTPDQVAKDFAGLLRAQGVLFALSGMHPPEPGLPDMVTELQRSVATVILTSRGPEFRSATERELGRNEYDFAGAKWTPDIVERRGSFKPYDVARPDAHGLSTKTMHRLGKPRTVSYVHGIYMTAGQHKGYMLKALLARRPADSRRYKAIVFVDDHEKHVKAMMEAFKDTPKDLALFRYSREDGNVARFERSSKRHVVRAWKQLQKWRESALVQ